MEPSEARVVLILADISGYTKFMVENQLSAMHGQMVITTLIETILREVDIPLNSRVSKAMRSSFTRSTQGTKTRGEGC